MPSNCAKRRKLDVIELRVQTESHPEIDWSDETKASYDRSDVEINNLSNDESAEWSKTPLKCSMCGNSDHQATSCPNSCCLKVCSYFTIPELFFTKISSTNLLSAVRRPTSIKMSVTIVYHGHQQSVNYVVIEVI